MILLCLASNLPPEKRLKIEVWRSIVLARKLLHPSLRFVPSCQIVWRQSEVTNKLYIQ
jgi:hypothetical protein